MGPPGTGFGPKPQGRSGCSRPPQLRPALSLLLPLCLEPAAPKGPPPVPPHHVAVPLAGGAGLGAGLAAAGPAAAAERAGQARLHHRLRQRFRQPAGPAAGPEGLPGAGSLPDPKRGRGVAAGLHRAPPHHPAGRHPLRQHPARRRVGAGGGGRKRAFRAGEQRGGGQPHRPHGVDADRGLPAGAGRQHLRGHRGDAGAAAAAEAGAGPRGQHLQRPRPPLRQRRRLLPVQILHRGLLRQPQARHAALRGEGEHRGARLLQDGRHRPGGHRGGPAGALGAPGPRNAAQLRRGFLPPVPEGAAAHHEPHLRRRPGQGDRLHGARAGRPAPAHPLQRGLGRQAALAARLLPARLHRRPGPGPHPAQTSAQPALGAPPRRCPPPPVPPIKLSPWRCAFLAGSGVPVPPSSFLAPYWCSTASYWCPTAPLRDGGGCCWGGGHNPGVFTPPFPPKSSPTVLRKLFVLFPHPPALPPQPLLAHSRGSPVAATPTMGKGGGAGGVFGTWSPPPGGGRGAHAGGYMTS